MKIHILFILTIVTFPSCSREHLLKTESQKITTTNDEIMFRFYDNKTQIRYDFRNDDSLLYVILETDNNASQARILRKGVQIFLSNVPSIDESRYLLFPSVYIEQSRNFENRNKNESDNQIDRQARMESVRKKTLSNISKQAIWSEGGIQQTFIVGAGNKGVDYYINFDPQGYLHYEARISLNKLTYSKKEHNTVIGVKIATFEMPEGNGGKTGGGRMNAGMSMRGMGNGMNMGGMRGGMGGGMGIGGMRSGGMRNNETEHTHSHMESVSEKINWWHQLNIK